jgi:hypothetical protein
MEIGHRPGRRLGDRRRVAKPVDGSDRLGVDTPRSPPSHTQTLGSGARAHRSSRRVGLELRQCLVRRRGERRRLRSERHWAVRVKLAGDMHEHLSDGSHNGSRPPRVLVGRKRIRQRHELVAGSFEVNEESLADLHGVHPIRCGLRAHARPNAGIRRSVDLEARRGSRPNAPNRRSRDRVGRPLGMVERFFGRDKALNLRRRLEVFYCTHRYSLVDGHMGRSSREYATPSGQTPVGAVKRITRVATSTAATSFLPCRATNTVRPSVASANPSGQLE